MFATMDKELSMKDYQLRVIEEKKQLDGKTERLESFCYSDKFKEVKYQERILLTEQCVVMKRYSMILNERISLF